MNNFILVKLIIKPPILAGKPLMKYIILNLILLSIVNAQTDSHFYGMSLGIGPWSPQLGSAITAFYMNKNSYLIEFEYLNSNEDFMCINETNCLKEFSNKNIYLGKFWVLNDFNIALKTGIGFSQLKNETVRESDNGIDISYRIKKETDSFYSIPISLDLNWGGNAAIGSKIGCNIGQESHCGILAKFIFGKLR